MQKTIPPRTTTTVQGSASLHAASATPKPATKVTLADWTADGDNDDVNGFFGGEKRQRGGRKKRKKNKEEPTTIVQNWDDIYDPSRPNSYEEYKNSDEKILEVREWKDKLYAHMARRRGSDTDDSDQKPFGSRQSRSPFLGVALALIPTQINLHLLLAYRLRHQPNSKSLTCRLLNLQLFQTTRRAKMPMLGVCDFRTRQVEP